MSHLGPEAAARLTADERARAKMDGAGAANDDKDPGECVRPIPKDAGKPPESLWKAGGRQFDVRYVYRNANGETEGYILRFEARNGERKFFLPLTWWLGADGKGEWRREAWPPGTRPLFGLDELTKKPLATVLLFEGEKAALAMKQGPLAEMFAWQDVVAVTWPCGGKAVSHADFSPLRGRHVIIVPDADTPGETTADELVKILRDAGVRSLRRWKAPPEAPEGWDVADAIPSGWEPEALVGSILSAPEAKPASAGDRFAPVFLDDITVDHEPSYIIDGIFPAGPSFGVIPAPPKSLKSFFLKDALMHITTGKAYAGRKVLQGAVVYITSEGIQGVRRRLVAMRKHHGVEGKNIPFMLVSVMPNLGSGTEDLDALKAAIAAAIKELNVPLRAVVIDTLRRATPGKSENDAKDMSIFLANADALSQAFACFVGVAHHSPRTDPNRGSGTNAIEGACDVILPVARCDAGKTPRATITVDRMKDGDEEGLSWTIEVRNMQVGQDRNGQPKHGGYVVIVDAPSLKETSAPKTKGRKEPATAIALRAAFTEALDAAGTSIRVRGDGPSVKAVPVPAVLAEFRRRYVTGNDDPKKRADAQRQAFNRAPENAPYNRGLQDGVEYLWA